MMRCRAVHTALDNHVHLLEDPCTLTEAKICALGTEFRVFTEAHYLKKIYIFLRALGSDGDGE